MFGIFELAVTAIVAATLAPSDKPRPLNVGGMISADDYPLSALRRGEEGVVQVQVKVDGEGAVSECSIVTSSGSDALDEQTCAIFRARAQFEPARDRRGRPKASHYTQRITWRLEGEDRPALPRQAWMVRMTVGLASDQLPVECTVETTGLAAEPGCEALVAAANLFASRQGIVRTSNAVAVQSITEHYFYPVAVSHAPDPTRSSTEIPFASQTTRITVDADGGIGECEVIETSIPSELGENLCLVFGMRHFVPAPDSQPMNGTIKSIIYRRNNQVI